MSETIRAQILLPRKLVRDIERVARKEGVSKSEIVRRAAASYVQRAKRPLADLPSVRLGGKTPLSRKELYGARLR